MATEGSVSAETVYGALRGVQDPELNHNIVELGMVRDVSVEDGTVYVGVVPTTPHCPFGEQIIGRIKAAVGAVPGVKAVEVIWGAEV